LTEGTTKGYWAGGFTGTPAISTIVRTADRVTFSSDATAAMTSADLITAVSQCESGSNGVKGYWAGGQTGIGVLNCDKTTFSTDTTTAQTSAGIQRHFGSSPSGLADGTTLIALGGVDSVGLSASGHKITFATDIATNLGSGANLTTARQALAGLSTVAL
jgi:hypothetical protein